MEIELPYIDLREVTELDPNYLIAHDVRPLDEDKRIRVFCTQLMHDIIDETTLSNFDFSVYVYLKQRFRLGKRFPHRELDLQKCSIKFWVKMEHKRKELLKTKDESVGKL